MKSLQPKPRPKPPPETYDTERIFVYPYAWDLLHEVRAFLDREAGDVRIVGGAYLHTPFEEQPSWRLIFTVETLREDRDLHELLHRFLGFIGARDDTDEEDPVEIEDLPPCEHLRRVTLHRW